MLTWGMRKVALILTTVLSLLLGVSAPVSSASASSSPVLPSWAKSASIYEVNLRQFSTSANKFNALKAQLPRLKSLGVKILWLMPIHPISERGRLGSLGSPYAVADYKAVNPEYGTLADYKALVKKAHDLGFHVLMDWVGNHTGLDNVWTVSHPEWYYRVNGVIQPNKDWHDVADLNYDNADMRLAMIDALKYWVTEVGIDGYRCDYAGGVPTDFWEEANTQLQAIKPVFMLAENDGDFSLLNSAFVANYGWNLQSTFTQLVSRAGDRNNFLPYFDRLSNTYAEGTFPLNFITNHDENSWNGTEFERYGDYVSRFAALTFTLPGVPLIYNGQEIGLSRRLPFFESDPIVWSTSRAAKSKTDFYRKLVALKTKNAALWNGSAGGPLVSYEGNNDSVLVFSRTKGKNTVVVAVNLSDSKQTTTVSLGSLDGKYFKLSSAGRVTLARSAKLTVAANGYEIYSTTVVK